MKIAFLTPEFPHPKTGSSGGIGTSIMNLAKGLVKENCEVSILVYGQNKDETFVEDNITFYKIKNIEVKGLSLFLTQKKVQNLINKLVFNNKIDLVEAPEWTGFTAFMKLKCPLIIKLHGSDTYFCHLDQRKSKFKNKFLEKMTLKKADVRVSVSQFTAKLTNSIFKMQKHYTIIPNSIDIELFDLNKTEIKEDIILYFGTLIRKKGLLELPHIFNHIIEKRPQTKLLLIGKDTPDIILKNNSTWKIMEQQFSVKAINNVKYLGSVNYSDIKTYINKSTICVFPSFAEALPVSWIEAMAMQKPIVASNIGWANELIDNGINGFLVHPKSHKIYAEKILMLLENENLQKEFGKEARKKVSAKFSIEVVAKQNLEFYQKVKKN